MPEAEQPKPEGPFLFKVNGIEIKSDSRELRASEILELAAEHHAMPGKPNEPGRASLASAPVSSDSRCRRPPA